MTVRGPDWWLLAMPGFASIGLSGRALLAVARCHPALAGLVDRLAIPRGAAR